MILCITLYMHLCLPLCNFFACLFPWSCAYLFFYPSTVPLSVHLCLFLCNFVHFLVCCVCLVHALCFLIHVLLQAIFVPLFCEKLSVGFHVFLCACPCVCPYACFFLCHRPSICTCHFVHSFMLSSIPICFLISVPFTMHCTCCHGSCLVVFFLCDSICASVFFLLSMPLSGLFTFDCVCSNVFIFKYFCVCNFA